MLKKLLVVFRRKFRGFVICLGIFVFVYEYLFKVVFITLVTSDCEVVGGVSSII